MATPYYNWRTSGHDPNNSQFDRLSPNLQALRAYLVDVENFVSLTGTNTVRRNVRGGSSTSVHSWGAAWDGRYAGNIADDGANTKRERLSEWLLDNYELLGIMAVHDYAGARIWRRGRTLSSNPDHWWRPSTGTFMGESWATYFHIETDFDHYHLDTPIAERFIHAVQPTPPEDDMAAPTPTTDKLLRLTGFITVRPDGTIPSLIEVVRAGDNIDVVPQTEVHNHWAFAAQVIANAGGDQSQLGSRLYGRWVEATKDS